MFTQAKKKMIDKAMMEQHNNMTYQKELAMRQKKKKIDPEALSHYISACIQMKGMENNFYIQCAEMCTNLDNDLLNDKERDCLRMCNRKILKFVGIAKNNFKECDDEIKKTEHLAKMLQ